MICTVLMSYVAWWFTCIQYYPKTLKPSNEHISNMCTNYLQKSFITLGVIYTKKILCNQYLAKHGEV